MKQNSLLDFEKKLSNQTRFLLVDGHNLLFQMFFGFPKKIKNESGKVVSGTLGFISTILKIIKNLNITHTLIFFDKEQQLNNKSLDVNYKANRPDWSKVPEEDNPFSQIEDIIKVLNFLKINHIFSDFGFEADDYINTYIMENKNSFNQIFILSKDTDFYQLIDDKVFLINYSGKNTKILSENSIYEKLGIFPKHYTFFKALTGDSADNIKGVYGVGKVTAKKIVNKFPSVEKLFDNLEHLPKNLFDKLENKKTQLNLNQTIISFEKLKKIEFLPNNLLEIKLEEDLNGYQLLKKLKII